MEIESDCLVSAAPSVDLVALDDALSRLAAIEPAKAELVKLRFFAGPDGSQLAVCTTELRVGPSPRRAAGDRQFAQSWLTASERLESV